MTSHQNDGDGGHSGPGHGRGFHGRGFGPRGRGSIRPGMSHAGDFGHDMAMGNPWMGKNALLRNKGLFTHAILYLAIDILEYVLN